MKMNINLKGLFMTVLYGMIESGEPENKLFYKDMLINISKSQELTKTRRINKVRLSITDSKYKKLYEYTNNHISLVTDLMRNLGFSQVGLNHDADKWDEDMIVAYYNHFNNPHPTKDMNNLFDQVKYKHIVSNAHHPESWRNDNKIMDIVSWMEMLCDWISAGVNTKKSINDYKRSDTLDYYNSKNSHLLDFMPKIKTATEEWLNKYVSGINFTRYDLYRIYKNNVKE